MGNPVDTWMAVLKQGLAGANVEILNLLLEDTNVDGAVVLLNAYRSTGYESLKELIDGVVTTQQRFPDKPIALWAFGMNRHEVIEKAEQDGIVAGFTDPTSMARAMAGLYRYHNTIKGRVAQPADNLDRIDESRAAAVLGDAEQQGIEVMGTETLSLLDAYGITSAIAKLATSKDDLLRVAGETGYPLVMKIASEQIVHKSDVGGVRLGIANDEALLSNFDDMCTNIKAAVPDAVIDGVYLQPQFGTGIETIVGAIEARRIRTRHRVRLGRHPHRNSQRCGPRVGTRIPRRSQTNDWPTPRQSPVGRRAWCRGSRHRFNC